MEHFEIYSINDYLLFQLLFFSKEYLICIKKNQMYKIKNIAFELFAYIKVGKLILYKEVLYTYNNISLIEIV
jgi:hypothetical protein